MICQDFEANWVVKINIQDPLILFTTKNLHFIGFLSLKRVPEYVKFYYFYYHYTRQFLVIATDHQQSGKVWLCSLKALELCLRSCVWVKNKKKGLVHPPLPPLDVVFEG